MIHHVIRRCALIRICREVESLLCYGQERFNEVFLVCVSDLHVCIHPLKPVDC